MSYDVNPRPIEEEEVQPRHERRRRPGPQGLPKAMKRKVWRSVHSSNFSHIGAKQLRKQVKTVTDIDLISFYRELVQIIGESLAAPAKGERQPAALQRMCAHKEVVEKEMESRGIPNPILTVAANETAEG